MAKHPLIQKLSKSEKIWLKELIKAYFKREKVDRIALRVKLNKELEKGFDYSKLDYYLVRNDTVPTLAAIWLVDRDNLMLKTAEEVIKYIKNAINENPNKRRFDTSEIETKLSYTRDDMDLCFELIYCLGGFFDSGSSSTSNVYGFQAIEATTIELVNNILEFDNLESVIVKLFPTPTKSQNEFPRTIYASEFGGFIVYPNTAFILMRMDKDYKQGEDIHNAIKEVCGDYGIVADRADDIQHSARITDIILEKIQSSEIIIADLSGEKPNVYYEVGYAHAIKKLPILISDHESNLHFDLKLHKVLYYQNISELKRLLKKRFEVLKGKQPKPD